MKKLLLLAGFLVFNVLVFAQSKDTLNYTRYDIDSLPFLKVYEGSLGQRTYIYQSTLNNDISVYFPYEPDSISIFLDTSDYIRDIQDYTQWKLSSIFRKEGTWFYVNVLVFFIVEKDGSVREVRILKDRSDYDDSITAPELFELIKKITRTSSNKWLPALKNSQPVNSLYFMKVVLRDCD